jgi:serine/threonine-protein kinase
MGARDYAQGELIPGTVYQVIRRLGAGGMGTVYDVEDTTIGKRYVLKTLHAQLGAREDLARRTQNEARTLARLQHPNIVEVITAGVTGDDLRLPYYVMERLSGQSLRVVLQKKGALDLVHAIHIAIDLLDALDHAHEKSVIHRDVKPDNIFLHRTNAGITVTKLLDFGIVSLLDSGPRETAGRFLGTLQYASPEQLRGETPTPKMDIYCAGLVLFELIAGKGPFDKEQDAQAIAYAHLHQPAPRISTLGPVPAELDGLLAAALAKSPDARPRDAFSFASSLRNLKRALAPERAPDATGNRPTAPSVGVPSGAAPFVDLRRSHNEGGGYVVSPAAAPAPPTSAEPVARTTVRGMVAPTLGPPLAPAQDFIVTSSAAEPVDRQAPTQTLAVPQVAMGQGGTEMLPAAAPPIGVTMRAHPLPMADGVMPIRWPPERPAASSEGAQVRTLPSTVAPASSRAVLAMVLSAILGLAAVTSVLFLVRHQQATRARTGDSAPASVPPGAAPADPSAVVAMPAPILAPQAPEESPPPASAAASTAPAALTATASAGPRPAVARPRPSAAPKAPAAPAPAPAPSDRPGPGF